MVATFMGCLLSAYTPLSCKGDALQITCSRLYHC